MVDCLRSTAGCRGGDRRKERMILVVRLSPVISRPDFSPGFGGVEECEAEGFGIKGPQRV